MQLNQNISVATKLKTDNKFSFEIAKTPNNKPTPEKTTAIPIYIKMITIT